MKLGKTECIDVVHERAPTQLHPLLVAVAASCLLPQCIKRTESPCRELLNLAGRVSAHRQVSQAGKAQPVTAATHHLNLGALVEEIEDGVLQARHAGPPQMDSVQHRPAQ